MGRETSVVCKNFFSNMVFLIKNKIVFYQKKNVSNVFFWLDEDTERKRSKRHKPLKVKRLIGQGTNLQQFHMNAHN